MTKVLFFSRGRGYGHAMPDLAISRKLAITAPELDITFASYSTGAGVFRRHNAPLIDLELPEANSYLATVDKATAAIRQHRPDVVVAHEEFAALYSAQAMDVRSVFISAWLPAANTIQAESLQYCSAIVLIGYPGLFPLAASLRVKPFYTGPIIRKMQFTRNDRASIRKEMGISESEFVVIVLPGGSSSEAQSPIADLVLSAFYGLPFAEKRLLWVSAKDAEALRTKCQGLKGIHLFDFFDPIEKLIAASDVAITKGTRGAILDSAAVGTPSISLSQGSNSIDDIYAPRINTNVALVSQAVTPPILAAFMQCAKPQPFIPNYMPFGWSPETSVSLAAETVSAAIKRATMASHTSPENGHRA